MSKITITRASEWTNRLRQYKIFLDDQLLGIISNGEIKTFEVPPGVHKLKAKVDWAGSREQDFSITTGEMKYFKLSAFRLSRVVMPLLLGSVVLQLFLRRLAGINYFIWFAVPAFLLLVYYLTFGRNDYLQLQQTDSW